MRGIIEMSNYGNRPPDYYSIYKLPQTELIKLVQLDEYENVIYIVTSDKYAENYFLYEVKFSSVLAHSVECRISNNSQTKSQLTFSPSGLIHSNCVEAILS